MCHCLIQKSLMTAEIRASLATIKRLTAAGARVIVASHLGRPKAQEAELSLAPVAKATSGAIGSGCKVLSGKHG